MNALANSLKRIWSAKNRVPHLTGWGTSAFRQAAQEWAHERVVEVMETVQRNVPTAIILALNIFR